MMLHIALHIAWYELLVLVVSIWFVYDFVWTVLVPDAVAAAHFTRASWPRNLAYFGGVIAFTILVAIWLTK